MVSVALQQVSCGHIAFAVPAHDRDLPGFGNVATLDDGVASFNPTERIIEETIIRGRP